MKREKTATAETDTLSVTITMIRAAHRRVKMHALDYRGTPLPHSHVGPALASQQPPRFLDEATGSPRGSR